MSPHETIVVDGSPDGDTLTINSENRPFAVDDTDGNIMYQTGVGGSVITVRNMEHGTVIGNDGNPVYQW